MVTNGRWSQNTGSTVQIFQQDILILGAGFVGEWLENFR